MSVIRTSIGGMFIASYMSCLLYTSVPNGEQGEMPDMQQGAPNGEQGGMPDMQQEAPNGEQGGMPDMQQGNRGGGPGNMGSGVVALQYQDDDIDSYSAIFDYAMFSPDTADKNRLISSIKQLNAVSYTHLDVYKRQLSFGSLSRGTASCR